MDYRCSLVTVSMDKALGILLAQSKTVFSVMLRRQASIGKSLSGDSCGFGFYILTLL